MKKEQTPFLVLLASLVATVALLEAGPARAQVDEARPDVPGFRTDFGIQLSVGGHQCIQDSGGTGYAKCRGADGGWNTSMGAVLGIVLRPWRFFSVGLDFAYMSMDSRYNKKNSFGDFSIGPVIRGHLPIRIVKVVFEPNVGIQYGFMQGHLYREHDRIDRHIGSFFTMLITLDLYVIPKLGFGFDLRIIRSGYQEVCVEGGDATVCRGANDQNAAAALEETKENDTLVDEKASYPWKIFYGGHVVYYF